MLNYSVSELEKNMHAYNILRFTGFIIIINIFNVA